MAGIGERYPNPPLWANRRVPARTGWLGLLALLGIFLPGTAADAGNDGIGSLYELKMAPKICGWADAGDEGRLDATIDALERNSVVTPSDKLTLAETAEADLRSDPAKCARDGSIGRMYDDAVQFDD